MVEVSPGNIREFGKRMDELAEDWNCEYFPPVRFTRIRDDRPDEYPYYGEDFEAAREVQQAYDGVYNKMVPLVADVYEALKGLSDASEAIAKKYETAEERANAKVSAINKILTENMSVSGPQGPGSGHPGQQGPGDGQR